uniref:Testis-expressed sequence 264 protein n=1 Tax=Mesocestoides corti TaxID=53468 RepID=A0A5K3F091_MESCO
MTTLLFYLAVLLLFLLICTILLLVYVSGVFHSVETCLSEDIPFLKKGATFYYKINRGSYGSLGSFFTEAYSVAPKVTQCAVYYDDPAKVIENDCRSAIGVLLNDEMLYKAPDLEKNGFKKFQFPPIKQALYSKFPHTSFLSIFLGFNKFLPILRRKLMELGCTHFTFIEVYDEDTIHYIGITDDISEFTVTDFRTNKLDENELIASVDGKEKSE